MHHRRLRFPWKSSCLISFHRCIRSHSNNNNNNNSNPVNLIYKLSKYNSTITTTTTRISAISTNLHNLTWHNLRFISITLSSSNPLQIITLKRNLISNNYPDLQLTRYNSSKYSNNHNKCNNYSSWVYILTKLIITILFSTIVFTIKAQFSARIITRNWWIVKNSP